MRITEYKDDGTLTYNSYVIGIKLYYNIGIKLYI